MVYLEEYRRLSGIGSLLIEKASNEMLGVLSKAFSTKVRESDIKFIEYRRLGKGVELQDKDAHLGGILTSVEKKDAHPDIVVKYLRKHGARPFKV